MSDQPRISMTKLLVATTNPGKLAEYRELLRDLPVALTYLRDEGIADEIPETGTTFEANAHLKAQGYAQLSGLPTLADDSGLEVDALGGEPGVYSARYGDRANDAERSALVLEKLAGAPKAQRTARFVCVIAVALPDGRSFEARGTVEGIIANAPRGTNGFGYDPIFELADGITMAELPAHHKNAISHRAVAARAIRPQLASSITQSSASS
jgi:XTP/dITP diphosphohydrolase